MDDDLPLKQSLMIVVGTLVVFGGIFLLLPDEEDGASGSEETTVKGTAVFPSHGMVDEKISAAEGNGRSPGDVRGHRRKR